MCDVFLYLFFYLNVVFNYIKVVSLVRLTKSLGYFISDILTLYGYVLRLNLKHQETKKGAYQVQLCSNLQYSWVTSVILSNFCNFSQLVLSAHPLLIYQLLPSHQTFVIFSPMVIYLLFTLSTHPINAPAVHTTNTTLTLGLLCARSLRQYTFPSCHSDVGGSR